MTRKRKNVENGDEGGTIPGYGYVGPKNEDPPLEDQSEQYEQWRSQQERRPFPNKNHRLGGAPYGERASWNEKKSNFDQRQDFQQFGRQEERKYREFPKEVVSYLRKMEQLKKEQKLEDVMLETCAREIAGMETQLLEFREACTVVENVFGSSASGAVLFLSALTRLKHKQLLELLFTGTSARTVEKLIFCMHPVASIEHVQVIAKFADLLCDNWKDTIFDQSASFVMRCIVRVVSGLGPRKNATLGFMLEEAEFTNNEVKAELKSIYEKIAQLAFDFKLNSGEENEMMVSFVLQGVANAEANWKSGRVDEYVQNIVSKEHAAESIQKLWCGKNSSRFWECIVAVCREETRSAIWMASLADNFHFYCTHEFANFPLQHFMINATSFELANEIADGIFGQIPELLANHREGVVRAALHCVARHESLQEPILKQLRTVSNKTSFLYNVLTNNRYDGEVFDVEKSTLQGSLLLALLLRFTKTKTLSACIDIIPPETVREMATNKTANHVIQEIFLSKTLDSETKTKVADSLQEDWESVINTTYGSFVFEKVWEWYEVRKKIEVMQKLSQAKGSTKFFKFAMLKCDLQLFRKNRVEWINKWKKKK
ncbi:unnamed protein product [Caenorhabditis auriculariae]|uniref:Nucleolar protein 9 n=1 Tax=Caenorhabditis auriculariae TaxID=2777116 RepID=A0A8S1HQ25_9PELO|nr:unnamed protein product [Caenorhabditis auriculariae]